MKRALSIRRSDIPPVWPPGCRPWGATRLDSRDRRHSPSVEGYFEFRELGPVRIKGVKQPVRVSELSGLGHLRTRFEATAQRGLTKFVSEQEFESLLNAFRKTAAGSGSIIAVSGEAGSGKSRLFFEFRRTIDPRCLVLEMPSISHARASAYIPFVDYSKRVLRGSVTMTRTPFVATRSGGPSPLWPWTWKTPLPSLSRCSRVAELLTRLGRWIRPSNSREPLQQQGGC